MKTGHWTNEELDYLRAHFIEQGSVEVGRALDRNHRNVGCMAHYLGLRRGWGDKPRYRAFSVNADFFKAWSPDMAYVMGVIVTDGNIGERDFNIVSNDPELLEKVRDAIGSTHRITKLTGQNTYRLRVGHKEMVKDLIALGITERKSKTVTLPAVPDEFFFDFVRGYTDGDGMVNYHPRKALVLKLTTGSPFILDDVSTTITRLLGIDRHEPQAHTQTRRETVSTWYELTYCGTCAAKICEAMYEHSGNLFLSRKRQAFTNYTNRPKDQGLRHNGGATKYR